MVTSNQLIPGMILSINNQLYRVESSVKVTVPKGQPFIKTKLKDLNSNTTIEKNFKLNQTVTEITLAEKKLEYLYLEGRDYLFLDIVDLEQVHVPSHVIGNKVNYLKEGVEVKASVHGDSIFSLEFPQFLELMVSKIEQPSGKAANGASKVALLETGAKINVPPFIEVGDIIKIDTKTDEYIQRV